MGWAKWSLPSVSIIASMERRRPSARAGFDEGLAAHRRGDYATALREWRPLAQQRYASAQFNLGSM